MKIFKFLGVVILSLCVTAGQLHASNAAALNDVLKLKNAGLNDETIIAFIQSKNLNYELSADDTITLRNQVSAAVLNALLASGGGSIGMPAPAPPAPAAQPSQPVVVSQPAVTVQPAVTADAAYFYQELSPHGRWILVEDGMWCWQPTVGVTTVGWRPYWDRGRWVYTDSGWYWASDYSWGWAVFHYGRWHLHPHHGWIWFPDRVWGPSWVTWRSGGDYCGWAPLPPGAHFDRVAGGFIYNGRHVAVGFDFGLDWHHFNFCATREIGESVRHRPSKEIEVRNIYSRTTVINNYSVNKNVEHNQSHVINRGIDPGHVAAVRGRPVETIRIEDQKAPPPSSSPSRTKERVNSQTKTMEVYRPKWGDSRDNPRDSRDSSRDSRDKRDFKR